MPKSVDAVAVEGSAKGASSSLLWVIILQISVQVLLKGSIDDIWGLFMTMQLLAYISIYDTSTPANVEIYIDEFRKIPKFEILKPDNLLGVFWPGLTLQ
jgi:hypothetical protein